MNPRVRTGTAAALLMGTMACHSPADPVHVRSVEQLINSAESALLALNELDTLRYDRCDSLFLDGRAQLERRFRDTLARAEAGRLGNHYLMLRAARRMGEEHRALATELRDASARLRQLRNDLTSGALDPRSAATAIATERVLLAQLEEDTYRAFDNYRSLQHAWDRRHEVARTLAEAARPAQP